MTDEQYEPKPGDLVCREGKGLFVVVNDLGGGRWRVAKAGPIEEVSAESLSLAPADRNSLILDAVQTKFGDTGPNGR